MAKNGAKNGAFCIFWKTFSLAFPGYNVKRKMLLLFIFHDKPLI